jgi:fibronectin-binding autotransporter adhesin
MSLYRTGTGTVRIDTLNDFSGPVVLSGGVLEVTNVANAGTASPMGLGSVATNFWVMDGGTFRYLGPPPAGGLNRGLTVGAGGATFDLPAYWLRLDINGDVAGPGSIIKKGAGALLMGAGKNNVFFMGDAIVSQGFLRLRSNGSLGTNGTVYLNDANTGAMDTGFLLDADAGVWDFRRPIVINNQGTGAMWS